MEARINGVFLGFCNRERNASRLRIVVADGHTTAQVHALGCDDSSHSIQSTSKEVAQFIAELTGAAARAQHEAEDQQ